MYGGSEPARRFGTLFLADALLPVLIPLSACLFWLVPLAMVAQTTGMIEGQVTDPSGAALPGVTVEIASPRLQSTRTAVTAADGRYRFPSLPPGEYTVAGSLTGLGTARKKATVALDATTTVLLSISLSTTAEVAVTGEAPLVDSTSTTTGTTYNASLIGKLPVDRNYADVVRLQPGVQEDNGDTQGGSLALSVYGSTSAENLFLIDGVNTTNILKGTQGKAINVEFVEEVEVKTGGYQAEYGRNTGAVVNVITKQGGNEFHGGVFGYFDNFATRAEKRVVQTPDYSQSGDVQVNNLFPKNTRGEAGLSLGGYILRDRVWFFGAYDKVKIDRQTQPLAGVNAGETFPQEFQTNLYSGKLTFHINSSTDLQASVFADPQTRDGSIWNNPLGTEPSTYLGTVEVGGQDYSLRLNRMLGDRGIVDLQYGHHKDRDMLTPAFPDQRIDDYTAKVLFGDPVVTSGGIGYAGGDQSTRNAVRGTVSLFLGKHDVKVGGDYQKDTTTGSNYLTGGSYLEIYPCQDVESYQCDPSKAPVVQTAAGMIPVFYAHGYYSVSPIDLTPVAGVPSSAPSTFWSAFIQDEWRVLPNLVVNLGLRYDDEKLYRGDGQIAFDLNAQWAPRVGISWDFLKDGSSKLYSSFGRFYYAVPTYLNAFIYNGYSLAVSSNYSPSSLDQDPTAPRSQFVQGVSAAGELVDAGLKASYQDEFTVGVEKAIGRTFSVVAKYTYRRLGRAIEDRCDLDPSDPSSNLGSCALINPGSSGPAASGQIRTCNGSGNPYDPTAGTCSSPGVPMPAATRKFQGFEVMARKQVGDLFWAQASYLYSKLEGNYSGAVSTRAAGTPNSSTLPGFNIDFDYPQFLNNAYGRLELDRPHSFLLTGAYNSPFGLTASAGFYVRSGTPYTQKGFFNSEYGTTLFLEPRGSTGRTPTDWDANLSVAYNLRVGAVTITPQVFLFSLFNNQVATAYDTNFNPLGSFVGNSASPFYGQAGVEPGTGGCPAGGKPCTDNVDYLKSTARANPRVLRVALKIMF